MIVSVSAKVVVSNQTDVHHKTGGQCQVGSVCSFANDGQRTSKTHLGASNILISYYGRVYMVE